MHPYVSHTELLWVVYEANNCDEKLIQSEMTQEFPFSTIELPYNVYMGYLVI